MSDRGGVVRQNDAASVTSKFDAIVTDPPYYDAIDYAGLSDFFYVWQKRALASLDLEILDLPLTPKSQQAIMASEKGDLNERRRYVDIMARSFASISECLESDNLCGVVFAHAHPDAWATLIESLLASRLIPEASWPIDTELQNKVSAGARANLRTSVWMACRKREGEAADAFLGDVMEEMRPVIRDRLLLLLEQGHTRCRLFH